MCKAMGGVQAQVVRRLTGRLLRRTPGGKWIYISEVMEQEEEGFLMMEEYIRQRHNTVVQYIATRSLLDLCEGSERSPGEQVGMRWCEQVGLNLAGVWGAAAAAVEGGEGE